MSSVTSTLIDWLLLCSRKEIRSPGRKTHPPARPGMPPRGMPGPCVAGPPPRHPPLECRDSPPPPIGPPHRPGCGPGRPSPGCSAPLPLASDYPEAAGTAAGRRRPRPARSGPDRGVRSSPPAAGRRSGPDTRP